MPLRIEQLPSQHRGHPRRVALRCIREWPRPPCVHGLDEEGVPAIEVLELEGFEPVHVPVRGEDVPVITRRADQHAAPVPDEPGNVHGPIDLGDLVEDRRENVVEDDLPIEPDDEIVNLADRVEVRYRAVLALGGHRECPGARIIGRHDVSSGAVGADDGEEHDCDRETGHEQESGPCGMRRLHGWWPTPSCIVHVLPPLRGCPSDGCRVMAQNTLALNREKRCTRTGSGSACRERWEARTIVEARAIVVAEVQW